ncbi:MAG: HNH endonuclease [Chloroflexota bacterium]|nr:HNH endonuclease [Chloroflexota bacterium]
MEGLSSENMDGLDAPLSGVQLLHAPVLVLNVNYVPLNICTVRRAVILVAKSRNRVANDVDSKRTVEVLEHHRGQLRTVTSLVDVPSVIHLNYMVKKPFLPRKLSRNEVFLRDRKTCQYCGKKCQDDDLTLDHVVPRHQHGKNTWENVVAACNRCNRRKAGMTPAEANMLAQEPRAPDPNPYLILQNRTLLDEWLPYLPLSVRG